jgi:hypothetical protein
MKMSKKAFLLTTTVLLSSAVYADGQVTLNVVNKTSATLSVQGTSNIQNTKFLAMPNTIAAGGSVAMVMQKTGSKFGGQILLVTESAYDTITWSTAGNVTSFGVFSGLVGSPPNTFMDCSPETWNGKGDFKATCVVLS